MRGRRPRYFARGAKSKRVRFQTKKDAVDINDGGRPDGNHEVRNAQLRVI
jgi:hypothetical protein